MVSIDRSSMTAPGVLRAGFSWIPSLFVVFTKIVEQEVKSRYSDFRKENSLNGFGIAAISDEALVSETDIDEVNRQLEENWQSAGLGFFGLGLRKNYDNNLFLTGNIVPFHTGGTYPVDDLTSRFDIGVSKRTDKATRMIRVGLEKGNSTVEVFAAGGCNGKDKQNTHKIEIGASEIGKLRKGGNYLISIENGIKRGDMDYTATHPTSGNCTDLPSIGNYSNRQDNVQSIESDHVITGIVNKNFDGIKGTIKGKSW